MGIFDKVKKTTIESRRYEERLYEVALEEVEAGEVRKGLYSKAVAKADGDKEKADGIYLKLRVQSIMDDIESEQIDRRDNERTYKAFQEFSNKKIVETDGEPTFENAKRKVKGSRYSVRKVFLTDIYTVENKNSKNTLYQTTDLQKLHNWIDKKLK
jgi:hypothetical protein